MLSLVAAGGPAAHAKDLGQGFFLDLVALETARIEKQVCEEKHPEFNEKNGVAFAASSYSKSTGEERIAAEAEGDDRKRLLAHLPQLRTEIRARYLQANPQLQKSVCANYASAIEREMQQRGAAGTQGKKP